MQRVLEPELMDDERQAIAYAAADFSASNQWYVDQIGFGFPGALRSAIDIGCGPADVAIRLARANADIHITAIDGSGPMITLAREAVRQARLEERISLVHGRVPDSTLREHSYDAILSKDFLHHLPDPSVLWTETKRLARPGAAVYVMDLYRPETEADARRVVEEAAAMEDSILKKDFYNSLCAAFSIEEVRDQLKNAGLDLYVTKVSERHMLIKGSAQSFQARPAP